MANVTIERTGEILRRLFEVLISYPSGMRAQEVIATLRDKLELTEYEKGDFSSGGSRFDKIIRYATIDCVKAGWLIKDKGRWIVTPEGKRAYAKFIAPAEFYRNAQKLYREWKKSRKTSLDEIEENIKDGAAVTFEEAEEQSWSEIEQHLHSMPPYQFQKLVASLLNAMGYHVSWIAPPGKDGGMDIVAWNDPLGTRPPRIKVQVKREDKATDVKGLRSFVAVLGDSDVGIFVSAGGFTKDAEEEARTNQSRQVTLIDLERLFELWVEHIDKVDDEARDLFPLKPIYFLAPED